MAKFSVGRKVGRRKVIRQFNGETARRALVDGEFGRGREVFGFNNGQFSFTDIIEAALDYTGEADITISTWTAAHADLKRVKLFLIDGRLKSTRWLVDYSFETRQPAFCLLLRELFGDDCIRTTANHAKFVLLKSDGWRVVLQTSMNLNQNKRLENFWICEDPVLYGAFSDLIDEIYDLQAAGKGFGEKPRVRRAEFNKIGEIKQDDPFDSVGLGVGGVGAFNLLDD